MALTNPIFNLEENLDIYLNDDYPEIKNMKGHIEGIVEDDLLVQLQFIEKTWLEYLSEYLDIINKPTHELEIFYVVNLLKEYSFSLDNLGVIKNYNFKPGTKILIPQSIIDLSRTTNMQLEPNAYVLEFNYDYTVDGFTDPDDMIDDVIDFVYERTNGLITLSKRKIQLYSEADVNSVFRILKNYYKIDDSQYNKDSIKNILSSATNSQVVFSKQTNRKIEISMATDEQRRLVCVTYNRTKREVREFKY